MPKVITFAKTFPMHHPRAGEPTGFKDKILSGEKKHTIRAGNRWEPGDVFSPREWTGLPYRTKQAEIHKELTVLKTWNIKIAIWDLKMNTHYMTVQIEGIYQSIDEVTQLALNDGFEKINDFHRWFQKPFRGQIICWNETVNY